MGSAGGGPRAPGLKTRPRTAATDPPPPAMRRQAARCSCRSPRLIDWLLVNGGAEHAVHGGNAGRCVGKLNLGLLLTIDLRPQVLCCCTCLPGAQRVSSAAGVVRGTGQVLRDRSCTRARAAGHCVNGTVVLGWDERAPSRLLRPLRPLMLSACADGDTEPPHAASSGFRGRCLPQVRLSDLPGHSSTDWKQSSNDGTSRFWQ